MHNKNAFFIDVTNGTVSEIQIPDLESDSIFDLIGHKQIAKESLKSYTILHHLYSERDSHDQPYFVLYNEKVFDEIKGELFFGSAIFIPYDESIKIGDILKLIEFNRPYSRRPGYSEKDFYNDYYGERDGGLYSYWRKFDKDVFIAHSITNEVKEYLKEIFGVMLSDEEEVLKIVEVIRIAKRIRDYSLDRDYIRYRTIESYLVQPQNVDIIRQKQEATADSNL